MTIPVLFLESASGFPQSVSNSIAVETAMQLILALKHTRRANKKISLNSITNIANCELAPGKTLSVVLGGKQYREEWMFLKELAIKSPFSSGLDKLIHCADVSETKTPNGQLSDALTWASLLGTGTVSFFAGVDWRQPIIDASFTYLDDDCQLVSSKRNIKNISSTKHVALHKEWLSSLDYAKNRNSRALWNERGSLFPHLRFLDRVENQLLILEASGAPYEQAISCLNVLNNDAASWGGQNIPKFSVKVADGEHDRRRPLSEFRDEETKSIQKFDRHAYFTGGIPGRIHFRLAANEKKFVIAHVGIKLC